MTEDPERELTPEEDARIRSLLASARASEEAPDYVAARLDSVLADLAIDRAIDRADDRTADRVAGDHAAGSRPWWRRGRVLLAAAVGVGVVSLAAVSLPQLSGQQGSRGSGDKTASTTQGKSGPEADQPTGIAVLPGVRIGSPTLRVTVRATRTSSPKPTSASSRSPRWFADVASVGSHVSGASRTTRSIASRSPASSTK